MPESAIAAGRRAVLFRLEFGGESGWGHLVRSGALASELRTRGWCCVLWTASAPASARADLIDPFDQILAFGEGDRVPAGFHWLVVDHYGTTDADLGGWRASFSGHILVIDDEARRTLGAADLVVNARLGLSVSCYASATTALLGERYALLRRGLSRPQPPEWTAPQGTRPVLVMLGGTDPRGATSTTLDALADVDSSGLVPIVVRPGAGKPVGDDAVAFARFRRGVWLAGVNASELAGWAGRCRFAVSAAGGTLYELAALRLPFISVIVADNQRDLARAAQQHWGMRSVIAGPDLRGELSAAIRQICSGDGPGWPDDACIDFDGAGRVAAAMER